MIEETILNCLKTHQNEPAYLTGGVSFAYGELQRYVGAIQQALLRESSRAPVMLYGSKEIHMKAGILACLLSGVPYVPVDASFPSGRVKEMIGLAAVSMVIGDYDGGLTPVLTTREIEEAVRTSAAPSPTAIERSADDTAYIIFTSGSTGTPKGVMVSYRSVDSCARWLDTLVGPCRCVLNQAKFSFDLSVADLYLSLLRGAAHFALREDELRDFRLLFSRLKESGADTAVMTPSFAQLLLLDQSFNADLLPRLATILFCGEALQPKTAKRLMERFPGIRILNCYGPSEATFAVTAAEITQADTALPALPVGRAKSGVEIELACDGEVIIIGDSVAKGYLPPFSSSAFFTLRGRPAYRSGDYGHMKDGVLWLSGRRDSQIKLAGYRIELGDIENNLLLLDGVAAAAVVPKRQKDGEVVSLTAFVVPEKDAPITQEQIKKELQTQLPAYMMPRLKIADRLPLNANGKCDKMKLAGKEI